MWRHILAETVIGVQEWLAQSNPLNRTLMVIVVFILASVGFYFLGILGAFLGILLAVGMIDEIFGGKTAKKHARRQVFCSQCGIKQEWIENKLCEICKSPLHLAEKL